MDYSKLMAEAYKNIYEAPGDMGDRMSKGFDANKGKIPQQNQIQDKTKSAVAPAVPQKPKPEDRRGEMLKTVLKHADDDTMSSLISGRNNTDTYINDKATDAVKKQFGITDYFDDEEFSEDMESAYQEEMIPTWQQNHADSFAQRDRENEEGREAVMGQLDQYGDKFISALRNRMDNDSLGPAWSEEYDDGDDYVSALNILRNKGIQGLMDAGIFDEMGLDDEGLNDGYGLMDGVFDDIRDGEGGTGLDIYNHLRQQYIYDYFPDYVGDDSDSLAQEALGLDENGMAPLELRKKFGPDRGYRNDGIGIPAHELPINTDMADDWLGQLDITNGGGLSEYGGEHELGTQVFEFRQHLLQQLASKWAAGNKMKSEQYYAECMSEAYSNIYNK